MTDADKSTSSEPVVVFIASTNRSGSTVLGDSLGQINGCFHGGELSFLLGQFDGSNQICGCGRSISECAEEISQPPKWCPRICGCGKQLCDCSFWASVLRDASTNLGRTELAELGQFSVSGMKYRPGSILRLRRGVRSSTSATPMAARYGEALSRIYTSITKATGARVIVDSSKRAGHIDIGSRIPGVQSHVLHLVRDPRAIAYSWPRRSTDRIILGPSRVSLNWIVSNLAAQSLRRSTFNSYTLIRYEDFMNSPRSTLEDLANQIGLGQTPLPFSDSRTLHMGANHTVAGSPSRFNVGDIKLISDDEWQLGMSWGNRLRSTVAALPLLKRYGYSIRIPSG